MKTNKPNVYAASDYAGLGAKNASFYYGYESSYCNECKKMVENGEFCEVDSDHETEWCFVAKFNGEEITIPHSKLGAKDKFNVVECLMLGVGWILAKYKLAL